MQFRNAVTCKEEAQHFGRFICESHVVVVQVVVEETSGDDSRAAQGQDGDITSSVRLGIPLTSSQPEVLVEVSTDNDLLPSSKIQLIHKQGSQLNACLKESHGCIGYDS